MWATGVLLLWFINVYEWHWRTLLPISAALELIAFVIFFRVVSSHKPTPLNNCVAAARPKLSAGSSSRSPGPSTWRASSIGELSGELTGHSCRLTDSEFAGVPSWDWLSMPIPLEVIGPVDHL